MDRIIDLIIAMAILIFYGLVLYAIGYAIAIAMAIIDMKKRQKRKKEAQR